MIEKKLVQLKKWKKESALTDSEKSRLRSHMAFLVTEKPYEHPEHIIMIGIRHGLRIALSSFMFIIFAIGSVSAVADKSLPGDALYTFKINVNEEIKGAFIKNNDERLAWQKERIDTRLKEIQTLADKQTLTKAKQQSVQKALDSNVRDFAKELSTLSAEKPEDALIVTAELGEKLRSQKEALALMVVEGEVSAETDLVNTIQTTLNTVSEEELKIITKEIENVEKEVQNTEIIPDPKENTETENPLIINDTKKEITPPPETTVTPSAP